MNYRTIDMSTYPRRAHFDYFRSLQNPMLGVTVDVDVTALQGFCKDRGCSFYLAFMHAAALAADGVPELRRRIRDGGIVEYDACGTSHVEPLDDGTYCYCTLYHDRAWDEWLPYAAAARAASKRTSSLARSVRRASSLACSASSWRTSWARNTSPIFSPR